MDALKINNLFCPNCTQQFAVKDTLPLRVKKYPLILQCGHSVCEICIRTALDTSDDVVCSTCGVKTTPEDKNLPLYENFPLNRYMMGSYVLKQRITEQEDSKVSFLHTQEKPRGKKHNVAKAVEMCAECSVKEAAVCCVQCDMLYCNSCFVTVHKAGKALQKHIKVPVSQQDKFKSQGKKALKCEEHEAKLEFYCNSCNTAICSHCILASHHAHDVDTMINKNKEGRQDLEIAQESAVNVLKRLILSQKKLEVCKLLPNTSPVHTLPIEQQVIKHFIHLHSILQLQESKLLQSLYNVKQERLLNLKDIAADIETNINTLKELLDEVSCAKDDSFLGFINVSELTEKLLASQKMPCHLLQSTGGDPDVLTFEVDQDFMKKLDTHCCLNVKLNTTHKLVPTDLLPPNFVLESLDDVQIDSYVDSRAPSLSGSSVDLASNDTDQNDGAPVQSTSREQPRPAEASFQKDIPKQKNFQSNIISVGDSAIVATSHIKTPHDFWVHNVADLPQLKQLENQLESLRPESKSLPANITLGLLCLAQFSRDKKWYRARIASIKPDKKNNEQMVGVAYIDYGNYEILPISRLRQISTRVSTRPGFAIHCTLDDTYPVDNAWSTECITTFAQLLENNQTMMIVNKHLHSKFYVDLCKIPKANDSDRMYSIRDTLVFLGFAYRKECPAQKIIPPLSSRSMRDYIKPQGLMHGEIFDGCVSQIYSPGNFYIQKLGEETKYMQTMMEEMALEYSDNEKGSLFMPALNMPCAALFKDGRWYRARVTGIPSDNTVEVFYVDYGNKENIARNRIRPLSERYFKLPIQAIHSSLANLIPAIGLGPNRKDWSSAATQCLVGACAEKVLRVFVDSVSAAEVKVTLYYEKAESEICINSLLAQEGHAVDVGYGAMVEYRTKPLEPQPLFPVKDADKKICGKRKVNSLVGIPSQMSEKFESLNTLDENYGEENLDDDATKLKVNILSISTPGHFFVSLQCREKKISSLMESLQEFYEATEYEHFNWKTGDVCAAYVDKDKSWYRAVVVGLENDNQVKVFLSDFAINEIVDSKHLRKLNDGFCKVSDGSIKCHLAGINPCGGKEQWQNTSTEYFTYLASYYYSFYITQQGTIKENSLPVELWVKDIIPGGALTPTVEKWDTINKKLVSQGVAMPVKEEVKKPEPISSKKLLQEIEEKMNNTDIKEATDLRVPEKAKGSSKKLFVNGHSSHLNKDQPLPEITSEEDANENDKISDALESINEKISDTLESINEKISDTLESLNIKTVSTDQKFTDWLPAEPIEEKQFLSIPTNVDNDGAIFLHHCKAEPILKLIRDALAARFKDSKPKPEDYYWFPGQLCIAKYFLDGYWYRGKVISVGVKVNVLFVDYGNIEECDALELRKNVSLGHIPIQCHRYKFHDIRPTSESKGYPQEVLDFIHSNIVDKVCDTVLEKVGDEYFIKYLSVENGTDILRTLVDMNFAIYCSGLKSLKTIATSYTYDDDDDVVIENVVEEYEQTAGDAEIKTTVLQDEGLGSKIVVELKKLKDVEVSNVINEDDVIDIENQPQSLSNWYDMITAEEHDEEFEDARSEHEDARSEHEDVKVHSDETDLMYVPMDLSSCDTISTDVPAIIGPNKVYIRLLSDETPEIKEIKAKFEKITAALQVEGPRQPILKDPRKGQPCCVKFSEDGLWYRAVVVSVDGDVACVQYVDYGNFESVSHDRIRKLKDTWCSVPVQAILCHLWKVDVPENWKDTDVIEKLSALLFNKTLTAKIKERDPLSVEFVTESNSKQPVYQPLIDSGLLLSSDKP